MTRYANGQKTILSTRYVTTEITELKLALCEYSKIFENSSNYFTIRFNSKRIQLFKIFKYLSLLHNAISGNCNGDYGRQERNKLLPSLAPIVAIFSSYMYTATVAKTATIVSRHCG